MAAWQFSLGMEVSFVWVLNICSLLSRKKEKLTRKRETKMCLVMSKKG